MVRDVGQSEVLVKSRKVIGSRRELVNPEPNLTVCGPAHGPELHHERKQYRRIARNEKTVKTEWLRWQGPLAQAMAPQLFKESGQHRLAPFPGGPHGFGTAQSDGSWEWTGGAIGLRRDKARYCNARRCDSARIGWRRVDKRDRCSLIDLVHARAEGVILPASSGNWRGWRCAQSRRRGTWFSPRNEQYALHWSEPKPFRGGTLWNQCSDRNNLDRIKTINEKRES